MWLICKIQLFLAFHSWVKNKKHKSEIILLVFLFWFIKIKESKWENGQFTNMADKWYEWFKLCVLAVTTASSFKFGSFVVFLSFSRPLWSKSTQRIYYRSTSFCLKQWKDVLAHLVSLLQRNSDLKKRFPGR